MREPVRGSWWSHPEARAIFALAERLESRDDVLLTPLVSGKQTFVTKPLWQDLVSIGLSREAWQMRALTVQDRADLEKLDQGGEMRARKGKSELVARLLVLGKNVHTETGAHAKVLQSWRSWARQLLGSSCCP